MRNRRAVPRFDCQIEITLSSGSWFYVGKTKDISTGGVFIITSEIKPIGVELDLTFKLSVREEPIRARGVVRWIRETAKSETCPLGMGVQFVQLDPKDLQTVRTFLQARPPLVLEDD